MSQWRGDYSKGGVDWGAHGFDYPGPLESEKYSEECSSHGYLL